MKRTSVATAALAALTFFASCQKDDVPTPAQPVPAKIEKISMDDDLLKLTYDASGRVNTVTVPDPVIVGATETQFTVSYDASGRISKLSAGNNYFMTPSYQNGLLSKVETKDDAQEIIYTTEYEYLNGFVKSANIKVNDGTGTLRNGLRFLFNYNSNGNLSKTMLYMGNLAGNDWIYSGSHEYTYDNKINPLKDMKTLLLMLLQNVSANNVLVDKSLNAAGQVEETHTYTYTYNSSNLPVSASVQITEPGSAPVNKQLRFTYKQ